MEGIAKYLFEVGVLKRVKRSGWWVAGIDNPESIADHSFRTAIIGYILAHLAGADPHKTAIICLFHDVPEARINDQHYVAKQYLKINDAEKKAYHDQLKSLPIVIEEELMELAYQSDQKTLEHELAKEADVLECLIQALEYQRQGYQDVDVFINSNYDRLKHPAAIELADACLKTPPAAWWKAFK